MEKDNIDQLSGKRPPIDIIHCDFRIFGFEVTWTKQYTDRIVLKRIFCF